MSTDAQPSKPHRRSSARSAIRQSAETAKITVRVPLDAAKRFAVHASMAGQSKAGLFADMIETCCRRYVVHDHGKAPSPTPGEPG